MYFQERKILEEKNEKMKNISKFVKISSYKILYPNVNRKDLYFIWAGSESTEIQLKQGVTANLAKYVELFCFDCN